MPTKNEVNRLAEIYGLLENDFIVVADTAPMPGGEESEPVVRAQAWYRCGDCKSFDFSHVIPAIPEDRLLEPGVPDNQHFLSTYCAGSSGKRIGVLRYALTA